MPGVSVLSASPALGGFGSSHSMPAAMQNGVGATSPRSPTFSNTPNNSNDPPITILEIKEKAKENAHKVARGASAISLIKTARSQTLNARQCELSGDLKGALSAYINAGTLAQMFMDTNEYKAECMPGKKGVLYREFVDFTKGDGRELRGRVEALTAKLEELEKSSSPVNGTDHKPGGSIADRMRSLQDAGLSVAPKRYSREVQPTSTNGINSNMPPTPPLSPEAIRTRFSNLSLSSASVSASSTLGPPSSSTSASSSTQPSPHAHAFVPLSSLGPPSPTSSPSHSPQTSTYSLTEFSQHFPSIDELDELTVPGTSPRNRSSVRENGRTEREREWEQERDTRRDAGIFRNFPILPVDPGPRPSSTPNTPTTNSFASRPGSPMRPTVAIPAPSSPTTSSPPYPISPPLSIPKKPSTLGLGLHSPKPSLSSPLETPAEIDLPSMTNSIFPKKLYELMYRPGYKVLLIDVRNRGEFDREHIKADAIVCIEPSVLLRENVSGSTIEDSLSVAPRHDGVLFKNRDKFDLVAMYDNTSTSGSSLALSALVTAIYEKEFRKILKQMPVLIVGGLEAWKREFGDGGVVDGSESTSTNGSGSGVVAAEPSSRRREVGSLVLPKAQPPAPLPIGMPTPTSEASRYWTPPAQDLRDKAPPVSTPRDDGIRYSLPSGHGAPVNGYVPVGDPPKPLSRRPLSSRPSSNNISSPRPLPEQPSIPSSSTHITSGTSTAPISYPQFPRQHTQQQQQQISPALTGSGSPSTYSSGTFGLVSLPPQASINPSLSRRRSDYVDQSQEALSNVTGTRPPIDYPDLSSPSRPILRPPPIAASSTTERQDNRHRVLQQQPTGPKPPTIKSDYPVTYWSDMQIGTSGLKNLGNTCYMNATIQCLSATVPFARFFTDGRWKSAVNMVNPLGTKGNLAHAFADILHEMWQGDLPYLSPYTFRRSLVAHASQFGGSDQHDSQEFLNFLLDGLHEDLNRILHKPTWEPTAEREAELERLPQQIASDQEWKIYRMRDDSLIVDFFQGQFRNRLECLTCHKTSTTYNSFMYLTLPIPTGRGSSKATLTQCLDAFVKSEVMEKTEAWHCPNCKGLRRATKQLSLSRLPPVLLIHLKRFEVKGPFTDKIETLVDFPLRSLDLTNYMPPPLPPGVDKSQLNDGRRMSSDDPRAQMPPYKYDLYGVTNHSGNLSNGHYTAFIASRGGWLYCDDSRVQPTEAKEVVGRRAYVLFYKRTKP